MAQISTQVQTHTYIYIYIYLYIYIYIYFFLNSQHPFTLYAYNQQEVFAKSLVIYIYICMPFFQSLNSGGISKKKIEKLIAA